MPLLHRLLQPARIPPVSNTPLHHRPPHPPHPVKEREITEIAGPVHGLEDLDFQLVDAREALFDLLAREAGVDVQSQVYEVPADVLRDTRAEDWWEFYPVRLFEEEERGEGCEEGAVRKEDVLAVEDGCAFAVDCFAGLEDVGAEAGLESSGFWCTQGEVCW